ncbi:MAG TPA: helix-turn-helix domain-containing protein [Solirubrobacteraceae bacterium]|nr:helix-turn-helix domain-containing protein [Solirubrobacteraceae bacterium]
MTAAAGRRERTKAANRAAILRAALEAFGELGYEGVAVRDIVRRTPLASGTFYNYFPDKDAVFAAVVADAARSARRRVQAARAEAGSYAELVERGFRAYFEWVVEDPVRFAFLRRNLARGLGEALPPGVSELAGDLAVHDEVAPADLDYLAHAMVAVGVELGARMAERDPPDVDGATRFATRLFLDLERPAPGA